MPALMHLPWNSAAAGTDAPCVQDLQRSLTYAELETEARAFAGQLSELGVGEGDVIGIMLPNSVELLVAMLGAWIAGVTATPVNPTLTEREVSYQLEDARARLLVADRALRQLRGALTPVDRRALAEADAELYDERGLFR